jgi:hypothetical protein
VAKKSNARREPMDTDAKDAHKPLIFTRNPFEVLQNIVTERIFTKGIMQIVIKGGRTDEASKANKMANLIISLENVGYRNAIIAACGNNQWLTPLRIVYNNKDVTPEIRKKTENALRTACPYSEWKLFPKNFRKVPLSKKSINAEKIHRTGALCMTMSK